MVQAFDANAQTKILHYTETSGFDHQTRIASFAMFSGLALQYNLIVDNDSTGNSFSSLNDLLQYDIVVFSNTSGNQILDSLQRNNFEQFISQGGHVIAIHSATDTYRHSSANGLNTGTWDFYAETIGASVQENPNHVSGQPDYSMHALQSHVLLNDIPSPWIKTEEYYYWENGYYDTTNQLLLKVETTVGPNGLVNSYDSARATTWYREFAGGSRIFYTSLGHDVSNFTSNSLFYKLIRNAILWVTGTIGIDENSIDNSILVYPNPFQSFVRILNPENIVVKLKIYDFNMKIIEERFISNDIMLDANALSEEVYIVEIVSEDRIQRRKIFKVN